MEDNTPVTGTIETNNISTPQAETTDYKKLYEAAEKQKRDHQSYYGKAINERDELLKAEYSQDPSKIHLIQSEEMRNHITKIVFPEYSGSKEAYDEARRANRLVSKFEVDEQIVTQKVKTLLNVVKNYEPFFQQEGSEEKFFQVFDATNPRKTEEERFNLALEIIKLRNNSVPANNASTAATTTAVTSDLPPAPITSVNTTAMLEEQAKKKEQEYRNIFKQFKK